MSFVVFAIGAAHALPPIIGAIAGQSKKAVLIGTAIGGVIAVASGNPAFIAMDLIGLGAGTWIGFSMIDGKPGA